jgi:hypothetical protein
MSVKWQNKLYHLLEAAGEPNGGGGAGGSLFTPPTGGGKPAPNAGNAGTPPGTAPGSDGGTGNPNTSDPTKGGGPTDWKSALPKEFQEDATLKKFSDVSALAGAYVNLQKQLGKEKIIVPNEHTTEEQWQDIFNRLGVPKELDKYEVKYDETLSLDKDFVTKFKTVAHQAGVLPKQAQKIMDMFQEMNRGAEDTVKKEMDTRFKTTVANLQKEWGNAFQQKVQRANKLLVDMGGEEVVKHFNTLGLGSDEKVFKFLAGIADKVYGEHTVVGGDAIGARTPKEVQAEINKIMGDKNHPYWVKDHAGHKAAIVEVQELHKELAGG